MAQHYDFHTEVGTGDKARTLGYSPKERPNSEYLAVTFVDPTGKRLEKMTRGKMVGRGDNRKPDATFMLEAARIIATACQPVYPDAKKVTWQEAINSITGNRPATVRNYRNAVRQMLATLNAAKIEPQSPTDITPELAERFKALYKNGKFTMSDAEDANQYTRSKASVNSYLRQLRAVWKKQFIKNRYAKSNPWAGVDLLDTKDIERKPVPTDEAMNKFFEYVETRYPQWIALHAFLRLKKLTVCRLRDICLLSSDQVADGRVTWTAAQVKNKHGRSVPLNAELFQTLRRVAGESYLWQGIIDGLKTFRVSKQKDEYPDPIATVANVVANIFREFSEANPKHAMSSHAFRRWGLTHMAKIAGSIGEAAHACGVTPACAERYYVDPDIAYSVDRLFEELAKKIPPQKSPTNPPLKPNKGESRGTEGNTDAA